MSAKLPPFLWSYSASRLFEQCQRKWYFADQVANHRANHKLRHEAYLLSQLQSLEAWRGSVVDDVIEKHIVVALNSNVRLDPDRILRDARKMFQTQLAFALARRSREEGLIKTDHQWEYAALYDVEYGKAITDSDIDDAWQEVEAALINLFSWDDLMLLLSKSIYRIAQRRLIFSINEIKVVAVPDVILFFDNEPPLILDWKVKRQAEHGFRGQLACYALALVRCKPHRDFDQLVSGLQPTDIGLMEVQLLTKNLREYDLSPEDVDAVEAEIYSSGRKMLTTLKGKADQSLFPHEYDPTSNPEMCETCQFQKMCWIGGARWANLLRTYTE